MTRDDYLKKISVALKYLTRYRLRDIFCDNKKSEATRKKVKQPKRKNFQPTSEISTNL